jgi:phage recombination protein Bet
MNNLTTINQEQPLAAQFTPEQMQLITSTVAKGASPQELQLFLYRCKLMGLNPLKPGQIHFVKYGTSPGTIVVGIEGFRSIAARTGKLSGIERGVNKDENGRVVEGWAKVFRSDWQHPAIETVPMSEYNTGKAMWAKMPETMIKKVAECAALRMAFPDDLGGVYESAELDQASGNPHSPKNMQPADDEGDPDAIIEYTPKFGKFARRPLEQIYRLCGGTKGVEDYFGLLERYMEQGKYPENHEAFKEFIERMSGYIADMENGPKEDDVP